MSKTDDVQPCTVCSKTNFVTDETTGEIICSSCGCVASNSMVDMSAEWGVYEDKPDRSRASGKVLVSNPDMGVASIISYSDRDASGNQLSTLAKKYAKSLRFSDSRTKSDKTRHRHMVTMYYELGKISAKLGVSESVLEKTAYIYRKVVDKNLVRGRSILGMLAACVYAACRILGIPRTINDISKTMNLQRKHVSRCYRLIFFELGLKVPTHDPLKCVSRIAGAVPLDDVIERRAINILQLAKEHGLTTGKDPMGIAAGALYLACIEADDTHHTQKELAMASGITEVTIRHRYGDLRDMLIRLRPPKKL